MADFVNIRNENLVLDGIQNSIVTLTDSVAFETIEFLATGRARILCKAQNSGGNPATIPVA